MLHKYFAIHSLLSFLVASGLAPPWNIPEIFLKMFGLAMISE